MHLIATALGCSGQVAFRKPLTDLIKAYKRRGGLTAFVVALRAGECEADARVGDVLKTIAATIKAGPITYAGGALGQRIFRHDALVLRRAELAREFSKREIPVGDILNRLVVRPDPDREAAAAR